MISTDLDKLIAHEEAEIARIQAQCDRDLADARARVHLLRRARKRVDPELDVLAADLQKAGLWPPRIG